MTKTTTLTSASCGWPRKTYPGVKHACPCGFIFPDKVTALFPHWHEDPDDWMNGGDANDDDLDFG